MNYESAQVRTLLEVLGKTQKCNLGFQSLWLMKQCPSFCWGVRNCNPQMSHLNGRM